jgi:hypothetical protein
MALLVLCGCRKSDASLTKPGAPASGSGAPADSQPAGADPAAVSETDLSGVLAGLTQAVRKYSFEKQRSPRNLEELVTAGYLAAVPVPPAGKTFTIDEKKSRVTLTWR